MASLAGGDEGGGLEWHTLLKSGGKREIPKFQFCLGFPLAWLALGGRKRIPWFLATFGDIERREHALRSSAGAHTCTVCTRGTPACSAAGSTRKDPRAEETKMPTCKESPLGTY